MASSPSYLPIEPYQYVLCYTRTTNSIFKPYNVSLTVQNKNLNKFIKQYKCIRKMSEFDDLIYSYNKTQTGLNTLINNGQSGDILLIPSITCLSSDTSLDTFIFLFKEIKDKNIYIIALDSSIVYTNFYDYINFDILNKWIKLNKKNRDIFFKSQNHSNDYLLEFVKVIHPTYRWNCTSLNKLLKELGRN